MRDYVRVNDLALYTTIFSLSFLYLLLYILSIGFRVFLLVSDALYIMAMYLVSLSLPQIIIPRVYRHSWETFVRSTGGKVGD